VVSSGGPILLSSATMFVRDWIPASHAWDGARRLRAYQTTTIVYGVVAALVAWLGPVGSILDLLLFGFAMVVPPAIAAGFVLYWPRTTEAGAFWGIVLGYALGLLGTSSCRTTSTRRISPPPFRSSSFRWCRSSPASAATSATRSTGPFAPRRRSSRRFR
jgi:Na+/proline symporter